MAMGLRLRVAANGAATSALRHAVAPCACPLRMAGGLAARTLVQRRFATKSASHVKYSEKKTKLPVILLQDCNLGRAGDEVQVSPGYMRNYLYERKVAVHSTLENKRKYYVQRSVQDRTAFLRPARIAAALSSNPLVRIRPTRLWLPCQVSATADSTHLRESGYRSCTATLRLGSSGQRARSQRSTSSTSWPSGELSSPQSRYADCLRLNC